MINLLIQQVPDELPLPQDPAAVPLCSVQVRLEVQVPKVPPPAPPPPEICLRFLPLVVDVQLP